MYSSGSGTGVSMEREKIRFASGGSECAAWHYPGNNGGCAGRPGAAAADPARH